MSRWFVALTLALALLAPAWAAEAPVTAERQSLQIETKAGIRSFSVELAATDAARAQGLMFRRELPADHGMLFDFGPEQQVAMWMKNTFIPLDMLFIRGDGRIHRIEANTKPHSLDVIQSGVPVRAVLEVIGGTARKLGIMPGDRVIHPMFDKR